MKKVLIGFAGLAAIAVSCGFLLFTQRPAEERFLAANDECAAFTWLQKSVQITPPWPFGTVGACRKVDSEAHIFGEADVTVYYLVQTESGVVGLRVDYTDLDAGRQYQARAREVGPDDISGITEDERRALRTAVASRGGVHPYTWMVHYGDG
jgi:hypothetical protein